jgi:hypothetical protein
MAATTTEGRIAEALFTRLQALVLSPALPVAYPDKNFDNPSTGMWLEAALFETPTTEIALGSNGSNSFTGFMQVTVVARENSGMIAAKDVAGQIINWFKRGTRMFTAGVKVEIVRPAYVSSTTRDEPYTRTPITIRYQAYASQ